MYVCMHACMNVFYTEDSKLHSSFNYIYSYFISCCCCGRFAEQLISLLTKSLQSSLLIILTGAGTEDVEFNLRFAL